MNEFRREGLVVHDMTLCADEAQEALSAIRRGEIDALVVSTGADLRVLVLKGADYAHQVLFETLNEGAMALDASGAILWANRRLVELLARPLEDLLGSRLSRFVVGDDAGMAASLMEQAASGASKGELRLLRADGQTVPVLMSVGSVGSVSAEPEPVFTVVVTDLSALKQAQAGLERANDELEARVEARTRELSSVNDTLKAELERRSQLEDELRRTAAMLRDADRRKDEFLSMLAHELRNPLAPLVTAAELLRPAVAGHAAGERYRSVIERQVRNLSRLVDDLLDASRASHRAITLKKQVVELGAVVRSALEAARPAIDGERHELTVQMPRAPLYLMADPTRLEQVLVNLLNNAAKYTQRGGHVALDVEPDGDAVSIRVTDDGVGIAPDLVGRVFDLFVQAERSLDRAQGGLGIGLTMVKSIVEMHDGTVKAHSAGPGRGSEFTVRLPMVPGSLTEASGGEGATASAPPRGTGDQTATKVLVVEDNADAAETLIELLSSWGYEVRAARDGESAIQIAMTFEPAFVLLDVGLPGMDGYEVAVRLRDSELSKPSIIAISGYAQPRDRRRGEAAGFDCHLLKPVDPASLRQLLERGPLRPACSTRARSARRARR